MNRIADRTNEVEWLELAQQATGAQVEKGVRGYRQECRLFARRDCERE